ncbi:PIG-L deacetylase family protein [Paenibacillus chitinolyticus]|uniref:PIG-L deacetylase family protein n=1 Tax=Paenibacillus chitinolyticus TaxID=79263 RepID=UPI003D00C7BA
MNQDKRAFLFISPHFDDVVLSCASTLMELVNQGHTCKVLTVFGGCPSVRFQPSEIARQYAAEDLGLFEDEIEGEHLSILVARRLQEDQRAFRHLAGVQVEVLSFPDAIYRENKGQPYYRTEEDLFGIPDEQDEADFLPKIETYLQSCDLARKYTWVFPAVSKHVDHQLLTKAGLRLMSQGYPVLFYSEFPYWQQDNEFSQDGWHQLEVRNSVYMPVKRAAVLEYKTQLLGLFGEEAVTKISSGEVLSETELFWIQETDTQVWPVFRAISPEPLQT